MNELWCVDGFLSLFLTKLECPINNHKVLQLMRLWTMNSDDSYSYSNIFSLSYIFTTHELYRSYYETS